MTRQKKELENKIDQIHKTIENEEEMGCGFILAGWFQPLEEEIYKLEQQLAELRHYDSVESMYLDTRGTTPDNLPFY